MIRKISAHYVFPVTNPPIKFGIIICSSSGEIIDIIDNNGAFKEIASLEFYDGILVPGFIKDDSETDRNILEKLKVRMNENSDLNLKDVLSMPALDKADQMFGSFEKKKCPGVNLISKIDFTTMRLTDDSLIRTLVPMCVQFID